MDNDQIRFLLLGIVIAAFIPQFVTILCLKKDGRSIVSADTDCGTDATFDGKSCICVDENKFWNGKECIAESEVPKKDTKSKKKEIETEEKTEEFVPPYLIGKNQVERKEKSNFEEGKSVNFYEGTADSFSFKPADFYLPHKHERAPGVYPALETYNQVGYTDINDVLLSSSQAALNANQLLPFLSKTKSVRLPDRKYNLDIDRTEEVGDIPEPESTLHYGIDPRDNSADYAANSLGMSVNYPFTQLTDFAGGDLMTSFQPINHIHRPFILPEMVNKLPERTNERVLNGDISVKKPPNPADFMGSTKMGEVPSQVPYPVPSTGKDSKLYWQSEIPERNDRGVEELQIWQVGNPLMKVQSDVVPRNREFRNRREAHIPDTVKHGFYGEYLNPLDNVTNNNKAFYATNGDLDYAQMRNISDRMTREHEDRILPDPRPSGGNVDMHPIHNTENIRATSNKVYDNSSNIHPIRESSDRHTIAMPDRSQNVYHSRQLDVLEPYETSTLMFAPESQMPDRSEIMSFGPGDFNGF